MSDNKKRILEMLETGKITSAEALELLSAIEKDGEKEKTADPVRKIRYLRVVVDPPHDSTGEGAGKVNIRVPVSLIKAGMKLTSLMPESAAGQVEDALKEKGLNINFKNIKDADVEDIIEALRELEVDVDSKDGKVRVFAE